MRESQPGVYEAFPVEDWFTFTPKIKYTTLNDEEAEAQFLRRHKTQNHYNLMLQKRLNENLGGESEYENSHLRVHDADLVLGDSDDANDDMNREDPTKKRKKKIKKAGKSKEKDEEELNKEKDDEDNNDAEASKEVDYMSDSDSEDEENDESTERPDTFKRKDAALKEEGQLFQESDEEEESSEMKKLLMDQNDDESGSDIDEESEEFKAMMMNNKAALAKENARERSSTPVNGKEPPSKKQKVDKSESYVLNEENVWRKLIRKPISTKELIAKFKTKRSGLSKQEIVQKLSTILKKIAKQMMKDGVNYFVIKDEYKNLYKE